MKWIFPDIRVREIMVKYRYYEKFWSEKIRYPFMKSFGQIFQKYSDCEPQICNCILARAVVSMRTICLALTLTLIVLVAGCATEQIPADGTKIIFTSDAAASFWTSTSDKACAGFRSVGKVNGALSSLTREVQSGVPIQVRGRGNSGLFVQSSDIESIKKNLIHQRS